MKEMTNELKHEELNRSIDSILSRGEFASTGDEHVDALARLASGLRGLPSPEFRARLRAEIVPQTSGRARRLFKKPIGALSEAKESSQSGGRQTVWISRLPVISWFRGQRVFLAGGGSCGLVAGACCISGAAANVLGIASAAAVTEFIDSALPYFVALSIVSMAVWLLFVLRDRGFTATTVAQTVRRHGFAVGSAYGLVFGASMALTMAMGLY